MSATATATATANGDAGFLSPYRLKKAPTVGGMLREIEEEASKLVSQKFSDVLWLTKAMEELDKVKGQLSESTYKARVLILNAQIVERISCAPSFASDDRISATIMKLDHTIKESERMARTPALDHFQAYAKCLLLERIGDSLMNRHSKHLNTTWKDMFSDENKVENDVTYAFASYMLALDAVQRASPVTPRLAALCAIQMLTLRTILMNVSNTDLDQYKKIASQKKIGESLFTALQSQPQYNNALSYICSIKPSIYSETLTNSFEQDATKIWVVVDSPRFLQWLIWLIAFNKDLHNSSMSFMDSFLNVLPDEPDCDNLQTIDERSLSRKDVKVLLIACSEWAQVEWRWTMSAKLRKVNAPPPVTFVRPPYAIKKFWNALLVRLDPKQRLNSASLIAISNCLELTRLRHQLPDVRIVSAMRQWLLTHGDREHKWARLCSNVAVDLIKGTLRTTCKNASKSNEAVLPIEQGQSISTVLEGEIFDAATSYLSAQDNESSAEVVTNPVVDGSHVNGVDQVDQVDASVAGDQVDVSIKAEMSNGTAETNEMEKNDTKVDQDKASDSNQASSLPQLSLLERLEIAAKLTTGCHPANESIQETKKSSHVFYGCDDRLVLNLRQFIDIREAHDTLEALIESNKRDSQSKPSKPSGTSYAVERDNDLIDAILNAQYAFEEKQNKALDRMLGTIQETSSASAAAAAAATTSLPHQQQSLVPEAYMNGVYMGWSLHAQNFLNNYQHYQQQQQMLASQGQGHGLVQANNNPYQFQGLGLGLPQQLPVNMASSTPPLPMPMPFAECSVPPSSSSTRPIFNGFVNWPSNSESHNKFNTSTQMLPQFTLPSQTPDIGDNDALPHDPAKCFGCADEHVQDSLFRTLDFLADNYRP